MIAVTRQFHSRDEAMCATGRWGILGLAQCHPKTLTRMRVGTAAQHMGKRNVPKGRGCQQGSYVHGKGEANEDRGAAKEEYLGERVRRPVATILRESRGSSRACTISSSRASSGGCTARTHTMQL